MAKNLVPLRPSGFLSTLSQEEQTGLTWMVISGCSRREAFITFCRPDMLSSKAQAAIDDYIKQFFARKEVKDYLEAYEKTLNEFLHPVPVKKEPEGSLEERKVQARKKAMEFAISLADNLELAENPEDVLKLMDKVGILDGEEQVEEQPRRYLPVSPCLTGCAYRMFCEENTEDMCQYCRYHKFGEDNGIHYDKTEILDVPQRSGTELASTTE